MTVSRAVAFHEAGHVVATWMVGEHVYAVHTATGRSGANFTLRKGAISNRALGLVETSDDCPAGMRAYALERAPERRAAMWTSTLNSIFSDGAGAAAEARASRRSLAAVWLSAAPAGDLARAIEKAEVFAPDHEAARRVVFKIWNDTAPLIARGIGWQAVKLVAEGILAGLDAEALTKRASALTSGWPYGLYGVSVAPIPDPGDAGKSA